MEGGLFQLELVLPLLVILLNLGPVPHDFAPVLVEPFVGWVFGLGWILVIEFRNVPID